MREVNTVFQKGFAVGLRPDKTVGTTSEHLSRCYNMVPNGIGLEPRSDVINPLDVASDWPWPVVFVLSRHVLLFTRTALYRVNNDWSITYLMYQDWGSIPHIADFMDTVVWSTVNGQWMISIDGVITTIRDAQFKRCCNFKGQLIVADCKLPNGPERDMSVSGTPIKYTTEVGGSNIVAWSKIGAIDWTYSFGNEVGWAPMNWPGSVLGLLPLGGDVVVYGDNGIAKLKPVSKPVVTFGIQDFGDVGVLNANCFAGDASAQIYLGADYNLYKIVPEKALSDDGKRPTLLGYKEFLSKLQDPIMTFDSAKRHWWIGDKDACFIFTEMGLSEASITPTHLGNLDGALIGCFHTHGTDQALVETGAMSFDSRGIKTLMCVEADCVTDRQIYGYASFNFSYRGEMRRGKTIRLDPRGAFFPILSGVEFKIALTCDDFRKFYVYKLWFHHKNTDKTFSRGVINAGRSGQ